MTKPIIYKTRGLKIPPYVSVKMLVDIDKIRKYRFDVLNERVKKKFEKFINQILEP